MSRADELRAKIASIHEECQAMLREVNEICEAAKKLSKPSTPPSGEAKSEPQQERHD